MTDTEILSGFDPAGDFADALVSALPAELLGGVDPEALRRVLAQTAAPMTESLRPVALRAEAVQLQQKAGELLDQADALEQAGRLSAALADVERAAQQAEVQADRLADAARVAVQEERDAADRLAEAREVARLARERVEDLALTEASPDAQVEAVLRRNAAEQIAGQFNATAEKATARRLAADATLATAREAVRQARIAVKAAMDVAANPPAAPASAMTAALDGLRRLAFGLPLDPVAEDVVAASVEMLMRKLDLDRIYVNRGRKAEQEEQLKRATPPLPKIRRESPQVVPPPGVGPIAPLARP